MASELENILKATTSVQKALYSSMQQNQSNFNNVLKDSANTLKAFNGLTEKTGALFNGSFSSAQEVMRGVGGVINQTKEAFGQLEKSIQGGGDFFINLANQGNQAASWIQSSVPAMAETVGSWFGGLSEGSQEAVNDFTSMAGGFLARGSEIAGSVGSAIGQVAEFAGAIGDKVAGAYQLWGSAQQMMTMATQGYQMAQTVVTSLTKGWQVAQVALNVAMSANPIGLIILAIAALIGGIILIVSKTEGWGEQWKNLQAVMTNVMERLKLKFQAFVQKLVIGWTKFKAAFGFGSDEEVKKEEDKLKKLQKSLKDLEKNAPKLENKLKWKKGDPEKQPAAEVMKNSADDKNGIKGSAAKGKSLMSNVLDISLKDDNATKQGVAGITGGGAKQTNITVNVGKLVESIAVQSATVSEGAAEIRDAVQEELLRVLNSANRLAY